MATVKAGKISTIVVKPTVRAKWFLGCWNILRIAVKTFHPSNRVVILE